MHVKSAIFGTLQYSRRDKEAEGDSNDEIYGLVLDIRRLERVNGVPSPLV